MKCGYFMYIIVSVTVLRTSSKPSSHRRVIAYGEKLISNPDPLRTVNKKEASVMQNITSQPVIEDISLGITKSDNITTLDTYRNRNISHEFQYDYDYLSYLFDSDYFEAIAEIFEPIKNISTIIVDDKIATVINVTTATPIENKSNSTFADRIANGRNALRKASKVIASRLRSFRYTTNSPKTDLTTIKTEEHTADKTAKPLTQHIRPRKTVKPSDRVSLTGTIISKKRSEPETKNTNLREVINNAPQGKKAPSKRHSVQFPSSRDTKSNSSFVNQNTTKITVTSLSSLHSKHNEKKQIDRENKYKLSEREKRMKMAANKTLVEHKTNVLPNITKLPSMANQSKAEESKNRTMVFESSNNNTLNKITDNKKPAVITNIEPASLSTDMNPHDTTQETLIKKRNSSTSEQIDREPAALLLKSFISELNSPKQKQVPMKPVTSYLKTVDRRHISKSKSITSSKPNDKIPVPHLPEGISKMPDPKQHRLNILHKQKTTTKQDSIPLPNLSSQLGENPLGTNPRGTSPFGRSPQGTSPFGSSPGGTSPQGVSSHHPLKMNGTAEIKPPQNTTSSNHVKEERFHVQIKKPDGSINGNYVVLDHLTGNLNGVRYDAVDGADQELIQRALLSFLSLDPRLDPRPS